MKFRVLSKRFLNQILFFGVLFPSVTLAEGGDIKPYIEGHISQVFIDDVDGTTSVSASGFNLAIAGVFEYENATALGTEIGLKGIGHPNIRLGISYQQFDAELKAIDISAALSFNGTVLTTAAGRVTKEELEAAGAEFGDDAKAYSLNAYYDLDQLGVFKPYLGLGIGFADIENTEDDELMISGYFGINYLLTKNIYMGLRGAVRRIDGPTDLAGIDYDDITYKEIGAVLGITF